METHDVLTREDRTISHTSETPIDDYFTQHLSLHKKMFNAQFPNLSDELTKDKCFNKLKSNPNTYQLANVMAVPSPQLFMNLPTAFNMSLWSNKSYPIHTSPYAEASNPSNSVYYESSHVSTSLSQQTVLQSTTPFGLYWKIMSRPRRRHTQWRRM